MSHRSKGSSLPPLQNAKASGRSQRGKREDTSYEYRSDSTSPPTPRSRSSLKTKSSPRELGSDLKDVNKDFRTLCIGSPLPRQDSDPNSDDLAGHSDKRGLKQNSGSRTPRGRNKAPEIMIDKVEELRLGDTKSPRGSMTGRRSVSPTSYEYVDNPRSNTPFSKSRSNEKLLSIEPTTPPVERKGNRQVINYYKDKGGGGSGSERYRSRSDGQIPNEPGENENVKHSRSRTDESQYGESQKRHSSNRRDPSPRLTRRARENEQTFSNHVDEYDEEVRQTRRRSSRQRDNQSKSHKSNQKERTPSPSNRNRQRRHRSINDSDEDVEDVSPRSARENIKRPVHLEPLETRRERRK